MVTYCVTKIPYHDTMIAASSDKEWLYVTTHQNISSRNYFKPPGKFTLAQKWFWS